MLQVAKPLSGIFLIPLLFCQVIYTLGYFINRYVEQPHLPRKFRQNVIEKFLFALIFYLNFCVSCHEISQSTPIVYYAIARQLVISFHGCIDIYSNANGILTYRRYSLIGTILPGKNTIGNTVGKLQVYCFIVVCCHCAVLTLFSRVRNH